jgi:hypothetical protein
MQRKIAESIDRRQTAGIEVLFLGGATQQTQAQTQAPRDSASRSIEVVTFRTLRG